MNPNPWPIDRDSWPIEERPCVPGLVSEAWPGKLPGCCLPCHNRVLSGWGLGQHCATHCSLGTERERDLTMPDTNETNTHRTREDYIR